MQDLLQFHKKPCDLYYLADSDIESDSLSLKVILFNWSCRFAQNASVARALAESV